jgi:hypothetical protein
MMRWVVVSIPMQSMHGILGLICGMAQGPKAFMLLWSIVYITQHTAITELLGIALIFQLQCETTASVGADADVDWIQEVSENLRRR